MNIKHDETINKQDKFLKAFYLPNPIICDNLIRLFNDSSRLHHPGRTGRGVQPQAKQSTDLSLYTTDTSNAFQDYLIDLKDVMEEYKSLYKIDGMEILDEFMSDWGIVEGVNIQRYLPGEGYHHFHAERTNVKNSTRMCVFMTFLNDIEKDGETEFYFQKLKVKPKKGLTVLWPSDWQYLHRGIVAPEETKYIITGWWNYYEKDEVEELNI